MGSSNSKKEQTQDLYFEEIIISKISTQYQTERKNNETNDVFVQNLPQDSKIKKTEKFSTFIPPTQDSNNATHPREKLISMLKNLPAVEHDEFDSDGMDSDWDDWESDVPECDIRIRIPTQNHKTFQQPNSQDVKRPKHDSNLLSALKSVCPPPALCRGYHPGGTNPTLGVRNFEMSSELSEMNYEVTTVNTSAIQS